MKTLIRFFAATLLLTSAAVAQEKRSPYIISPRVGAEIDANERMYFGLLLTVNDFQSARFFLTPDSSVTMEVTRQTDSAVVSVEQQTLTRDEVNVLRDYVERFETRLYKREAPPAALFDAKLLDARSTDFTAELINTQAKKATITTREAQTHAGYLLCATDSVLVLWKEALPYDWRRLHEATILFRSESLKAITLKANTSAARGFGVGFLGGAALGAMIGLSGSQEEPQLVEPGDAALAGAAVFGLAGGLLGAVIGGTKGGERQLLIAEAVNHSFVLQKLRPESYFALGLPPELLAFAATQDAAPLESIQPVVEVTPLDPKLFGDSTRAISKSHHPSQTVTPPFSKTEPRFRLLFTGAFGSTSAGDDMLDAHQNSGFAGTVNAFLFGYITYPKNHSNVAFFSLGLSVKASRNVRFLIERNFLPTQRVEGIRDQFESSKAGGFSAGFEIVPYPFTPRSPPRLELSLGAGLSTADIKVNGELRPSWSSSFFSNETLPHRFALGKRVLGGYVSGTTTYFLGYNTSLYLRLRYRLFDDFKVPSELATFTRTYTDYRGQTITQSETQVLPAHALSYSGMEFAFGLGLHF